MKERALNKKLAEWVGFYSKVVNRKSADFNGIYLDAGGQFKKMPDTYSQTLWHDPDIAPDSGCRDYWYAENGLPNFPNSLDACFKWLVPKVIKSADYSIIITQNLAQCIGYIRPMQGGRQYDAVNKQNPALALCLAIEKLIDGGGNR